MSRPSLVSIWVSAARPRTLPAAVAPVVVGAALAWRVGAFNGGAVAACLAFALLVQIGTNFANDYFDFIKGADTAERVGPRRAVAAGLVAPAVMRAAMIAVFAAAFFAGLSLLAYGGWPLVVIGLASILCGVAYTGGPYPLGYNGLGDVFVFLFFGLVAVCATVYVQTGHVTFDAWVAACGVGALAANILVVNNYRDVETDAKAGKRTLVVRWGRRAARWQFGLSHGVAFVVGAVLAWRMGAWGPLLVLALLPLAWTQQRRLATETTPAGLIALLGKTGAYLALYALVLSLGIALAR